MPVPDEEVEKEDDKSTGSEGGGDEEEEDNSDDADEEAQETSSTAESSESEEEEDKKDSDKVGDKDKDDEDKKNDKSKSEASDKKKDASAEDEDDDEKKERSVSIFVFAAVGLVKFITYLYEYISWPLYRWFSTPEPTVNDQGPLLAKPTKEHDPASPWRCVEALADDRLTTTMFPGCAVLGDLWERAARLWPDAKIMGDRPVLKINFEEQANGRKFKKLSQGPYRWQTFAQIEERIDGVTKGLLYHLKLQPQKDKVLIFAETRLEWMVVAQACFRAGIPLVTLYATLGDDALVHGVDETEVRVLFTTDELLEKVMKLLPRMKRVKHVIYMRDHARKEKPLEGDDFKEPKSEDGMEVLSMFEFQTVGKARAKGLEKEKQERVKREELAVIMYTSGSTGQPKGVEITHANLMCSLSGLSHRLPVLTNRDRYIAYLPLAHVLELCAELVLISNGILVGYGTPLTLLDNSNKVRRGTKGDVSALRPTLMACVPTIMDRLYKTVWETVNKGGSLVIELFKWALEFKTRRLEYGFPSVLMDRVIFRKIRKILGGKVRFMLSGGAPLGMEAQEFINACFCRIVQGYGLTETCGAGTLVRTDNLRGGHTGAPLRCLQIKLRPWKDGNYDPQDKPYPRGEVVIGGECVVRGYFNQPQKTKEDFETTKDGMRWFFTGDIGQFNADGTLSIIDRKKDLVKLQSGEYISLGKVELALANAPVVETVCAFGDSNEDSVVAIVVPKKKQLLQLAGDAGGDMAKLCKDKKVRQAVLKQLQETAKEKHLERSEIPVACCLDPNSWSPDTGLVTDALKLKRRAIQEKFQDEIDEMYGRKKEKKEKE